MELVLGFSVSKLLDWRIETLIATLKVDDPNDIPTKRNSRSLTKKIIGFGQLKNPTQAQVRTLCKAQPML